MVHMTSPDAGGGGLAYWDKKNDRRYRGIYSAYHPTNSRLRLTDQPSLHLLHSSLYTC